MSNYNIFEYKHKQIISKSLNNFKDNDFKRQVMLSANKNYYTRYDLTLFYKHIRNIKLCVNKLFKNHKKETKSSLKNSIIFLFENYIESFVNSIILYYFRFPLEENSAKQEILNEIVELIYDEK